MKIAFFVSGFPVRSETFILTQIAGLLDRGHEVDIWANEIHDASQLHSDFAHYRLLERVHRRRHVCGGTALRRLVARVALMARSVWRRPRLVLQSVNVLRFGKKALSLDLLDMALCFPTRAVYDVVHCHFGPNGNDAALLMDLGVLQGKLVTTFHSYDVLQGIRTDGAIYRPLMRHADAVHSISDYNRKWLQAFGFLPARIHDHPMAIDTSRFPTPVRGRACSETVHVLTVARLAPAKGLNFAFAALAQLQRERPEIRLRYRVVGGGPLEAELRAEVERCRLGRIVELSGPQDQSEVRAALANADIFLLPSLEEALPVAIMEAMASGLPVIATDVGSVAELVRDGETGRLVPAADANALKVALADLIDGGERERRKLGKRGRALVTARHDAEVVAERLLEHYRALVRGAHPNPAARSRAGSPVHRHDHSDAGRAMMADSSPPAGEHEQRLRVR